ncbi:DUF1360 domain-containing protein [Bacillus marinisedimentorum]|uniref:DUF1360 domain-containing protein n=1 Tax=Bacillus marinisedimentorum TaxID=1821260 RepID=UPI0007DF9066|nr:DUF1360 domain-containing protein [Bacillus marinisedimentorum]
MTITWLEFFLLSLAVFRLTRLIVFDAVTEFLRRPFHEIAFEELEDGTTSPYLEIKGAGLRHWIGELLSCYWCTGIWSSVFLVAGYWYWPGAFQFIILILAGAGAAAVVETAVQRMMD